MGFGKRLIEINHHIIPKKPVSIKPVKGPSQLATLLDGDVLRDLLL